MRLPAHRGTAAPARQARQPFIIRCLSARDDSTSLRPHPQPPTHTTHTTTAACLHAGCRLARATTDHAQHCAGLPLEPSAKPSSRPATTWPAGPPPAAAATRAAGRRWQSGSRLPHGRERGRLAARPVSRGPCKPVGGSRGTRGSSLAAAAAARRRAAAGSSPRLHPRPSPPPPPFFSPPSHIQKPSTTHPRREPEN